MSESKQIKIKIGTELYLVEVGDITTSPVNVNVNGNIYSVDISNHLKKNIISPKPKIKKITPKKEDKQEVKLTEKNSNNDSVVSPMPGTILAIKVSVGDKVKTGDELLVLESMKMENMINSHKDGIISKILVSEGDSVQHGQELVVF
ncbi:MAG: biotin/lipoyl-containing protein [Dehalococcoidia bacterium]